MDEMSAEELDALAKSYARPKENKAEAAAAQPETGTETAKASAEAGEAL